MKTKTLLGTLAIIGLLALPAGAQITVSTAVTNALAEPYNAVEDAKGNIYISDSANDRIVRIDASTQVATTLSGITGVAGSNDGSFRFDPPSMVLKGFWWSAWAASMDCWSRIPGII